MKTHILLIGLFLGGFYIFNLLFGHLITALLFAHYLNQRSDKGLGFLDNFPSGFGHCLCDTIIDLDFLFGILAFPSNRCWIRIGKLRLLHKKAAFKLGS